mmetsp:Transcript_16471/g.51572  ORF Transcript_16471/g.51572 Transcript_16471/m.51572 type:complete len:203 (+) Transcript_16471:429-1037(+)
MEEGGEEHRLRNDPRRTVCSVPLQRDARRGDSDDHGSVAPGDQLVPSGRVQLPRRADALHRGLRSGVPHPGGRLPGPGHELLADARLGLLLPQPPEVPPLPPLRSRARRRHGGMDRGAVHGPGPADLGVPVLQAGGGHDRRRAQGGRPEARHPGVPRALRLDRHLGAIHVAGELLQGREDQRCKNDDLDTGCHVLVLHLPHG